MSERMLLPTEKIGFSVKGEVCPKHEN